MVAGNVRLQEPGGFRFGGGQLALLVTIGRFQAADVVVDGVAEFAFFLGGLQGGAAVRLPVFIDPVFRMTIPAGAGGIVFIVILVPGKGAAKSDDLFNAAVDPGINFGEVGFQDIHRNDPLPILQLAPHLGPALGIISDLFAQEINHVGLGIRNPGA